MEDDGDWNKGGSADELLRQYAATRDVGLRDRIVAQHTPLVSILAANFAARKRAPDEDLIDGLIEAGLKGLVAAVETFDPAGEEHFSRYAARLVVHSFEQLRGTA